MADVTAIILTKNEEKNIDECLKSVEGFVTRAVIIDSGSTDNTVDIAKTYPFVDVLLHPFENYARQFNWGLDHSNITDRKSVV